MIKDLAAVAVAALTVLLLDAIWLGWLMRDFIQQRIGPLMLETPRLGVAALFYVLFGVAVLIFAVRPALDGGSLGRAIKLGALLGFFSYMTYDLTNLATLKGWSVQFALVDMAWGSFVAAVAAAAGYSAWRALAR